MRAFLILWCVVLCGCARRPAGVNYLVSRECKPQVRLLDCDRASPPRCKRMAADYPRGCEQIMANH